MRFGEPVANEGVTRVCNDGTGLVAGERQLARVRVWHVQRVSDG